MKLHQRIGVLVSVALFPLVWWGWYRFHVVVFSVDVATRNNVVGLSMWSFCLAVVTAALVGLAITED